MSIRHPFSIIILLPFFAILSCGGKDPVADPVLTTSDFRFSVSETQKVTLSSGNLQYRPSDHSWRFAPYQYQALGDSNYHISDTYNGWIDLFGWGTGENPVQISERDEYYADFSDWGNHFDGGWRTLSSQEWNYLLNLRPNASQLKAPGSVHRVKGLILLPDGWQCPPTVYFTAYPDSNETSYSTNEWRKMEAAGAKFLPYTGHRSFSSVTGSHQGGYYWTSNANDSGHASALYFVGTAGDPASDWFVGISVNPSFSYSRHCGLAVRLAKND